MKKIITKTALGIFLLSTSSDAASSSKLPAPSPKPSTSWVGSEAHLPDGRIFQSTPDGPARQIAGPVVDNEEKEHVGVGAAAAAAPAAKPKQKGRGNFTGGHGASLASDGPISHSASHTGGGHDTRGNTHIKEFQVGGTRYQLSTSDASSTLSYFVMSGHSKNLTLPHLTLEPLSLGGELRCHVTFGHQKKDGNYVEFIIQGSRIVKSESHGSVNAKVATEIVEAYLHALK